MDLNATPVRGIIFDKDGTMFDFSTTWEAWAAAFLMRAAEQEMARAIEIGRAIGFDLERRSFEAGSVVVAGTPGRDRAGPGPTLSRHDT